ncbi:MAG: haloacid dehalogenase-like hydrolase [Planctomycetota bacterium]|nr:haloacid dehalogenase-like hydrolase [Planctomycetota bacterium]
MLPRISGTAIEIVEEPPRVPIRHALFDLDGTLSLLRDGWQDQMVPMMVELIGECGQGESREELTELVTGFVDQLTGKQTIYQMMRLCEEIERRGGAPREPIEYKELYNDRLDAAIASRLAAIEKGALPREDFMVPGSLSFLEELVDRGVVCYLASGTDENLVRRDAALLGFEHLFEERISGALRQYQDFSKRMVIERIISEHELNGPELIVIGDGFVEIRDGRETGAVTFGIHTRENNRYHMNSGKRERLLEAGAHFLAPGLDEGAALLDHLQVG